MRLTDSGDASNFIIKLREYKVQSPMIRHLTIGTEIVQRLNQVVYFGICAEAWLRLQHLSRPANTDTGGYDCHAYSIKAITRFVAISIHAPHPYWPTFLSSMVSLCMLISFVSAKLTQRCEKDCWRRFCSQYHFRVQCPNSFFKWSAVGLCASSEIAILFTAIFRSIYSIICSLVS